MTDLVQEVDASIRAQHLLARKSRVLVAVSGGLDSMVLLHILHKLSKEHRWKLAIAHLNHQLRGRSSQADAELVAKTAKDLQLPIVIEVYFVLHQVCLFRAISYRHFHPSKN